MRAAAVLLYGLLTAPVCLELLFSAEAHRLPAGYLRLSVYGFSMEIPLRVLRPDPGGSFCLQIGNTKTYPIQIALKKPSPFITKERKSWQRCCFFDVFLRLGLGDACATALLCGGLRAVFSCFPRTDANIVPIYGPAGYFLKVRCIAVFRLGKLFLTAARVAAGRLAENFAGGSAHGNHIKPANQFRHADDP